MTATLGLTTGQYLRGPDGTLYVVANGRRYRLDQANDVMDVSEADLAGLPEGTVAEGVAPEQSLPAAHFDSGDQFLGAGHYMQTVGGVTVSGGVLSAITRTFTVTDLGGFHGAVTAVLADAADNPIVPSPPTQPYLHRYGVDGRWIGTSDRHDPWSTTYAAADIVRATHVHLFHTPSPDSFQTILNKWVTAGGSVKQLADDAAGVAKDYQQIVSAIGS
ncbi:hypothetical protein [Cryptosporangium phraense]|uniref:Uncharacterized protein n=1 Tax=Cryptosporangium phraense TaxID=2593070 RepID=A0A545ARW4_9ACTN|nr:hypothetical protein [Cryptosporangium phraense]TQS44072.1 hypothetical protein FL583_16615 [Cryptosporangium phraense]